MHKFLFPVANQFEYFQVPRPETKESRDSVSLPKKQTATSSHFYPPFSHFARTRVDAWRHAYMHLSVRHPTFSNFNCLQRTDLQRSPIDCVVQIRGPTALLLSCYRIGRFAVVASARLSNQSTGFGWLGSNWHVPQLFIASCSPDIARCLRFCATWTARESSAFW